MRYTNPYDPSAICALLIEYGYTRTSERIDSKNQFKFSTFTFWDMEPIEIQTYPPEPLSEEALQYVYLKIRGSEAEDNSD